MVKQLDFTTSIAITKNNAIHGIHFCQHTTFNRLNQLSSKLEPEYINIWGTDWTTWISNHSKQQMLCGSSSLNWILDLVMIVGLKIIHISLKHYTTVIFSNIYSSFCHISHFTHTLILNQYPLHVQKTNKYAAISTCAIGGGICYISFLPEWSLC